MGNGVSKKVNDEQIRKEVNDFPVVVYTRPTCGYCTMAKKLLNDEKIRFKENDLDLAKAIDPDGYQEYVNGLVYISRQTSVPQIFICGTFVGGYTELNRLHEAKKLLKAVENCSQLYDLQDAV